MIDATAPAARRASILKRIRQEGLVSLADLASEHAVSAVTVHRDLQLLSDEGLLERVRGGARSVPDPHAPIETGWNARLREAGPEKDAIAAAARDLIEDGSTIFIDASSTGLALAHAIELRPPADLTLVTNSPAIALGLSATSVQVIVAPGELDQHRRVLTGRWTTDFLSQLTFAAAFVSAAGISLRHGLTTSRSGLADTLNTAADSAERVIGLMDSTKFERSSLLTIRSAAALDLIITDDRIDPAVAAEFRAAGVSLQIASGTAEASDAEAD
jgi:DeoR/GlpR family transcriptional regulator of sugar metabolism